MKTTATTANAATANNATTTAKTKKRTRKAAAKSEATVATAPEQKPEATTEATAEKSKLLVFKRSRNNGFYVYLLGVMPDENIGCNCRTPQSAMRFMLWKKRELARLYPSSTSTSLSSLPQPRVNALGFAPSPDTFYYKPDKSRRYGKADLQSIHR